ncbi:hypothetical protein BaRGS_00024620, partial [Batillaria attramentaria]
PQLDGCYRRLSDILEIVLQKRAFSRVFEKGEIWLRLACDGAKITKHKDSVKATVKLISDQRDALTQECVKCSPDNELTLLFYMGKEDRATTGMWTEHPFPELKATAEHGIDILGRHLSVKWRQEERKGFSNPDLVPWIPFKHMVPDELHLRMRITSKLLNQVVKWCLEVKTTKALEAEMRRIHVDFRLYEEVGDDDCGQGPQMDALRSAVNRSSSVSEKDDQDKLPSQASEDTAKSQSSEGSANKTFQEKWLKEFPWLYRDTHGSVLQNLQAGKLQKPLRSWGIEEQSEISPPKTPRVKRPPSSRQCNQPEAYYSHPAVSSHYPYRSAVHARDCKVHRRRRIA